MIIRIQGQNLQLGDLKPGKLEEDFRGVLCKMQY